MTIIEKGSLAIAFVESASQVAHRYFAKAMVRRNSFCDGSSLLMVVVMVAFLSLSDFEQHSISTLSSCQYAWHFDNSWRK